MAQSKDQPRSKDQDLNDKMKIQILIPIILVVLLTSAVIALKICLSAPNWVQQVEDDSMQVEAQNLRSLADSAGHVAQALFQKVANDILSLNYILSQSITSQLQLNSAVLSDSTYLIGAKQFSENANEIMSQVPGFNSATNKTTLRSSWYAVGALDNVNTFNDGGWSALPNVYQTYYQNWLTLLSMIYTLLDPEIYISLYSPYDRQESNAQGLYCKYPLAAAYYQYVDYVSPGGDEAYFTYKTRPYYKQATQSDVQLNTVQFIYPYEFINESEMGYTACINTVSSSSERILLCLDYLPDTIQDFIEATASQKDASYFVIEKSTTKIMMYPNVLNILEQNLVNITQAEFGQATLNTQEAYDFDANFRSFLDNYNEETNFNMTFYKNENEYILSLCLFQVQISNTQSASPNEYAVGLIIPLSDVRAAFSTLGDEITTPILIQTGILVAVLIVLFTSFAYIMVGCVSKAITVPISKLVQLLRKIENPDDGEDEDKDGQNESKQLELILRWIPHIETLSTELATLHHRFTLIKLSFQYTKEAETALNDGDAIIKYSQALNIHKQLGNIRGCGMIYNSIANIHFKHGNYQEASHFYEQAISTSTQELMDFEEFVKNAKKEKVSDSLNQVIKKSSSNVFSTDMLDKVKAEFEEMHSNRLYFLAQTMLAMGQKKGGASLSTVMKIRELLIQVVKYDKEGKRNPYRVILCLLDIAATYLPEIDPRELKQPNNTEVKAPNNTEAKLNEANERLKIYEEDTLHGYEDELYQDYRVPSVILRQKYNCMVGRYLLRIGSKKKACEFFTNAIEDGNVYDPITRQVCLKHLETIFEEHGLLSKAPNIQKILYTSTKKNKDIVFVLDYSQSMGEGKRINVVISNILKMFDKYVQSNDRVGFIRFNLNCDVVFSLTEKKKNTVFLRKNIEESIKPSGGTALFNAIYEALKILSQAEQKNHAKWIIALTDGDDSESRISYEQLYRKLARSDINLIIIGLELHNAIKPRLNYLCQVTANGRFIESTSNEDLNIAFQVLSAIIYGSNVNVEKLAF